MIHSNFKSLGKFVLSKIPLFIFCVAFVSIFAGLFGAENSITGVILLISLLVYSLGDLGYQARQAAVSIPILLLLAAFGAKFALLNPFLGILVNLICIWFFLLFTSHNIIANNHIPIVLGYLFFQSNDVSGSAFTLRIFSIALISSIIGFLYFMKNKKKTYKRSVKDLFTEIRIHSTRTQWYIKLTLTLTIVLFIIDLCNISRGIWIAYAVFSVLQPLHEDALQRGKHRVPATLLACTIFYVLVGFLLPKEYIGILSLIVGFSASLVSSYFAKTTINAVCALCPIALELPTLEIVLLRMVNNMVGTFVAFLSSHVFNWHFKKRYSISTE